MAERVETKSEENHRGNGSRRGQPHPHGAAEAVQGAQGISDSLGRGMHDTVRASEAVQRAAFETARHAAETGSRQAEGILGAWSEATLRVFGVDSGDVGEVTERAERNLRGVSAATTSLVRGGEAIAREWFALIQAGVRSNLEGVGRLAACRSVPDLAAVQSDLARERLERIVTGFHAIASASQRAIEDATRALKGATPPAQA
ncbi:MAG TPA: phasin family protein [Caulobacteraceae bacterium]|nr:phasin family protein [Caulobacteraceae bacterium]